MWQRDPHVRAGPHTLSSPLLFPYSFFSPTKFFVGEGPPKWLATEALERRSCVALQPKPDAPQPSRNKCFVHLRVLLADALGL
jgi:hypothetical protein